MLRTALSIPRTSSRALGLGLGLRTSVNARRHIHHVPALPHDYSQGVPNLMSPAGFSLAWSEYMALMVEKLNALTAGTFSARLRAFADCRRNLCLMRSMHTTPGMENLLYAIASSKMFLRC